MRPIKSPTLSHPEGDGCVAAANREVAVLHDRKKKQGQYCRYDDELCINLALCWYAEKLREVLDQGVGVNDVWFDLRTVLMPLHTNWLVSAITRLSDEKDALKKPFETTGIIATSEE